MVDPHGVPWPAFRSALPGSHCWSRWLLLPLGVAGATQGLYHPPTPALGKHQRTSIKKWGLHKNTLKAMFVTQGFPQTMTKGNSRTDTNLAFKNSKKTGRVGKAYAHMGQFLHDGEKGHFVSFFSRAFRVTKLDEIAWIFQLILVDSIFCTLTWSRNFLESRAVPLFQPH